MQKEKITHLLDQFPEEINVDAFLDRLILLEKIEDGEQQLARGEGVEHDEAKQRFSKWLA